jgi:hypothetical protein
MTKITFLEMSKFYTIYGITTILILLLLIWFFVRTTLETKFDKKYCQVKLVKLLDLEDKKDSFVIDNGNNLGEYFPELNRKLIEPNIIYEDNNKPYKLTKGLYGDVPIQIYNVKDTIYATEWLDDENSISIQNDRTLFQSNEII